MKVTDVRDVPFGEWSSTVLALRDEGYSYFDWLTAVDQTDAVPTEDGAGDTGFDVVCHQSNLEGELVNWIQEAKTRNAAGIILNAGGYTTTSVAILDALLSVRLPTIEVHITNIHAREEFRHNSLISRAATGVICGLGTASYTLAITAIAGLAGAAKH